MIKDSSFQFRDIRKAKFIHCLALSWNFNYLRPLNEEREKKKLLFRSQGLFIRMKVSFSLNYVLNVLLCFRLEGSIQSIIKRDFRN
jgi:hypothetical protein